MGIEEMKKSKKGLYLSPFLIFVLILVILLIAIVITVLTQKEPTLPRRHQDTEYCRMISQAGKVFLFNMLIVKAIFVS